MSLVRIRELGPGDGDVVDVVFAGLSPRSRYLRFQGPVTELSAATRRSLTALDGRTHVALAAFAQGRPIGIVRIIDLGDGRGELAVEVVDRWQGCGVGTQLLQAARDRAAEHGLPRARRRDARGERGRPRGPAPRLPRHAGASRWFGADDNHGRRRRAGAGEPRGGTRRVGRPTVQSARPKRTPGEVRARGCAARSQERDWAAVSPPEGLPHLGPRAELIALRAAPRGRRAIGPFRADL